MMCDIKYIGKVARNIASKYFKEALLGVSVWGEIVNRDIFDPRLDTINIMIILHQIPYDELLLQSSIEFDYQTVLKHSVNVTISTLPRLKDMYLRGYAPYVLAVHNAFYAFNPEIFEKLKEKKYSCSKDAIDFSLERAFISFGMGLNSIIKGDLVFIAEHFYSAVINAATAVIQQKKNYVPKNRNEILEKLREEELGLVEYLFRDSMNKIYGFLERKTPPTMSKETLPLERIIIFSRDNEYRGILPTVYELLRQSWLLIKKTRIAALDKLVRIIQENLEDEYIAEIEISGIDPCPVIRIKKVGAIINEELI